MLNLTPEFRIVARRAAFITDGFGFIDIAVSAYDNLHRIDESPT